MRVLFVGNSYVYFNDLPGLLTQLAAAGGAIVETESVAVGGMTLLGHLRHGEAVARIREGGWNAVVLQEQSTRPIDAPAVMHAAARQLADEAASVGAGVVLFLTWAQRGWPEQQAALDAAYYGAAGALGARVAPVGPAWQRALTDRSEPALHRDDGSHPAPPGTYLAACVLYAVLTGRSPVGLGVRSVLAGDGHLTAPVDLLGDDVAFLQQVAWDTVVSAPTPQDWRGYVPAESDLDMDVALLQEAPLLHGLSSANIQALLVECPSRSVPAGTALFRAGEVGRTAYLLLDGEFSITPTHGNAVRIAPGRLGLALGCATNSLLGAPYDVTVSAATDVTVLPIPAAALDSLAIRTPSLVETIWANLRSA